MFILRRWLWSFCYNIMFYGRSQSEASFSVLTNQRPVIGRADQSETRTLLAIRGQSLTQCYCQSRRVGTTEREGGAWCDLPNVTDIFQSGHLTYLYFRRNILVLCDCPRICLIFADMTRGPRGLVSGHQVISQEQTHQMSPAHPGHCKYCGI